MIWSILLLVVAIVFILLEAFLPSGGMLGFLAGCAMVAAIVVAFFHGMVAGTLVLGLAVLSIPLVISLAVHLWPQTPLGRQMLIPRPKHQDEVLPHEPEYQLAHLVGRHGKARSKMLPSGRVDIEGTSYDAVSQGMAIEPETPVRVVAVRTNRIVVRPLEPGESPALAATPDEQDLLSRPAEQLGIEPFEDPLA